MTAADTRRAELLTRRRRLLGPAYRHFYDRPLEIVRGSGTQLFDADGTAFLDGYNNVPCVGHAHPRVTAAIADQAATLNTHTRYLSEPILGYAERLLESLGAPLEHVMFTATGSEATDLALRIARFETSRQGVIVTTNAYHGITAAAAEASPSLGPATAPGHSVRTISPPDYAADDPSTEGNRISIELAAAIEDLERAGHGFAAFICDSIFVSDGIRPEPVGVLQVVADQVRAHGGVFIADEVQAGFARVGEDRWGYRRHGILPDMVTMGKSMGGGMPIAAVACRPELLERFGHATRFFSTFGGSSVSIAAATAVLDVIEDERLAQNAVVVGSHLKAGLAGLEQRFPVITGSRGAGLCIGATVVDPNGDPGRLARQIVNGLRDRHVLVGLTGKDNDVLKIRPPLVFSRDDSEQLLAALASVLEEHCAR